MEGRLQKHELYTKGAFQKSELDCPTMAAQVTLTSNKRYPRIFAEKPSPSCTLSTCRI